MQEQKAKMAQVLHGACNLATIHEGRPRIPCTRLSSPDKRDNTQIEARKREQDLINQLIHAQSLEWGDAYLCQLLAVPSRHLFKEV
jgi:hypothetical protein